MNIKTSNFKNIIITYWIMGIMLLSNFTQTYALGVPAQLQEKVDALWAEYWFYCALFVSIGVLTGLLAFIVLFIRLGANSDNPQERSKVIKEMIAVAGCTAALGSITFIIGLYFSLFN